MKKRYFFIMVLGILILAGNPTAQAENAPQNVGNKICPVSGDKIDGTATATYEYEGKIYNFCCPMCIDPFKKDPQKYIKKIQEQPAV
jgi:YHS domain-containing protein